MQWITISKYSRVKVSTSYLVNVSKRNQQVHLFFCMSLLRLSPNNSTHSPLSVLYLVNRFSMVRGNICRYTNTSFLAELNDWLVSMTFNADQVSAFKRNIASEICLCIPLNKPYPVLTDIHGVAEVLGVADDEVLGWCFVASQMMAYCSSIQVSLFHGLVYWTPILCVCVSLNVIWGVFCP